MDSIVSLKAMGKVFHTKNGDVRALDNINLDIKRGEIFGIIGLSGAGKSTLVRCINYLEVPTEGDVFFEGKGLKDMNSVQIRNVRRDMGMIFQQFNLLSQRNILDNVCFPLEISETQNVGSGKLFKRMRGVLKANARARARELLKLVGLSDREKAYPAQLSGGQKQRVAIARAIATNPKLLLCDEATSALDPKTTKQILDLIKDINKKMGITVIVITHEMKVIESICDRVAIIENSKIAEMGKVEDIFANPQSDIGKKLILGDVLQSKEIVSGAKLRIEFDGRSSFEPVLSNMILSCGIPVNILYAQTKDIGGSAVGHMIVQISGEEEALKAKRYLDSIGMVYHDISFDEVKEDIE
ncbi:methionine ABC transporter ATP-binding protein [Lachnoanaerobaculum umeaense]|jgi:ABC superfamily ATP binding cassette transporter, ABC protein|uniref:Methionine ABC transporter ATP-binding protein n=1 Tax=Lachnoanaerobaculum umeaense TaxID=617123 RepID=A0A385Q0N9_9FIRM|nr:methionine ABC transporter ATP-binding protein [Lachnoanaerobaculum umeaense]AYA99988.1 methionine ABC transporter ATP-binding protein [Lachnoanaerobaculum umeaense]PZW94043.1 D-methionine transport system ATP-binding protein [Lachnoanaerobaculum umeaense]